MQVILLHPVFGLGERFNIVTVDKSLAERLKGRRWAIEHTPETRLYFSPRIREAALKAL